MFLPKLTYYYYRIGSLRLFNSGNSRFTNKKLFAYESLQSIHRAFAQSHTNEFHTNSKINTSKNSFGKNKYQIISMLGRPTHEFSYRQGGIRHDMILYKLLIGGVKTRVIYNFINNKFVTCSYKFNEVTDKHLDSIKKEIANTYNVEVISNADSFCLVDQDNNRLVLDYLFDAVLTYACYDLQIVNLLDSILYKEHKESETPTYDNTAKWFQPSV